MKEDQNPFTTLGLAASIFRGLKDADIMSLVRSQHRTLATIHHPDAGGDAKRFKEIQEALETLERDCEFDFWKSVILRTRKDQIASLRQENRRLERELASLQSSIFQFWVTFCKERQIFQFESSDNLDDSSDGSSVLGGYKGFSVFSPPPLSLIVLDSFSISVKQKMLEGNSGSNEKKRYLPYNYPFDNFELKIGEDGTLTRQKLAKISFNPRTEAMPIVRREFIEIDHHFHSRSYYWQAEGEPVKLDGKILGWIPKDCLHDENIKQDHPELSGLIPLGDNTANFQRVRDGFATHEFEPYLRFVRPVVKSQELLVYADMGAENDLRFKILGLVRKILRPEN